MADNTIDIMDFDVEEDNNEYEIAIKPNTQNDSECNIMRKHENIYYYTNHDNKVII
ncbi:hypothetical protein CHBEV_150 [Choristoneura biennis entomopoxvirus]|uniref:Uncharacterized protein n=1 Tax=Choristoneura biennis entomopoxvirus TaxID=10288 RepID=A0A916KPN7_CBEPV|nr:hypothetical protein CHBEV_150 [Choristoneura biennis entomopoxvirus]CCU55718.1 hypothetical protein CHBEV_150 [Choristoneura biennis entomopoxvirus]